LEQRGCDNIARSSGNRSDEQVNEIVKDTKRIFHDDFEIAVEGMLSDIFAFRVKLITFYINDWWLNGRRQCRRNDTLTDDHNQRELNEIISLTCSDPTTKLLKQLGLGCWELDDYCNINFTKKSILILKQLARKNRKRLAGAVTKKEAAKWATASLYQIDAATKAAAFMPKYLETLGYTEESTSRANTRRYKLSYLVDELIRRDKFREGCARSWRYFFRNELKRDMWYELGEGVHEDSGEDKTDQRQEGVGKEDEGEKE
jgi:hypothetical protein